MVHCVTLSLVSSAFALSLSLALTQQKCLCSELGKGVLNRDKT